MKSKSLILLFVSLFVLFSCDDGIKFDNPNDKHNQTAQSDDEGQLGGECYPNKTCNKGLTCDKENNTCIEESENTNDDDKTDTVSTNDDDGECTEGTFKCHSMFVSHICKNGEWQHFKECAIDEICNEKTGECEKKEDLVTDNDSSDTTPDDSDSASDNDTDTDSGDSTPDNDADSSDTSSPDNDTTPANPCNPNPCSGVANSNGNCTASGSTNYSCGCKTHYTWTNSTCTADSRVADCTGLPANAKWNTAESISQTWDGEEWYPSETGTYNTNPSSSECRFKCEPDYDWNGTQCWKSVDPCDPNPCLNVANSTKECIETGDTTYACKCNSGFNWIENQCRSNSTPSLPECSTSNTGPCYDSTSHLTWSKKKASTYNWSGVGTYCDNLTEGGYSDWRLPNISELRTLIKNCSGTQMPGGSCGVIDTGNSSTSCLSDSSSCWTESACSCSYDSTGGHSKFGETGWFWSSSIESNASIDAWVVNFSYGGVYLATLDYSHNDSYVRCVRNAD